jgi:hypothetical protein
MELPKKKIHIKLRHRQVELYDYQLAHKKRLDDILDKSPFALDFSMLGTGKTYTTSYIYVENLHDRFKNLVNVSPVSVKSKWHSMEKEYNIHIHKILSFNELRTVRFKQPKHGLLNRRDYTVMVRRADGTSAELEKVAYTCTKEYLDLVEHGVLLVIDEIQNIKNISNQLDACKELIRPIVEAFKESGGKSKSRVILLSGSPVDKKTQIVHLFRLLNIMLDERIGVYNPQTGETMWRGMQEIEDYCTHNFPPIETNAVRMEYERTSRFNFGGGDTKLTEYSYQLFNKLVKKYYSSAMDPIQIAAHITKLNAFYQLGEPTSVELLAKGIKLLATSASFNHMNGTVNFGHNGVATLQGITRALIMIETAKIALFARAAKTQLENNPNQKVVICVNYTETINDLMNLLESFHPLRLDGGINHVHRSEVLEKFQAGDTQHRLLIGNMSVCSSGIDLDDKFGQFPRLCLVSPNYSTITLYQLSHRFHRINTKSDSRIHFVFCKENSETRVLDALARKSEVMKEITDGQCAIVFPGDYQRWEEP